MKKFLVVALLISIRGLSQNSFNDSLAVSRNTYTRNAMEALGGFVSTSCISPAVSI
ncbi:hypothetical protein [Dinghuibacter silviterrae]|nr:hypothetical protein [Dinghuibacter silviterrae]